MIRFAFLAAVLCGAAAQAQLSDPIQSPTASAPTCPSGPVPGFHHFDHPEATALAVGASAKLTLAPAAGQTFAPPLARAPEPDSLGGTFPLTIAAAGTYRIALSAKAWIDLVGNGIVVRSIAHATGPDCSGIAKIVDFALTPGTYQVQLSAAKDKTLTVMVAAAK